MKLSAHRAGLPGKEDAAFFVAPLIPAYNARLKGCAWVKQVPPDFLRLGNHKDLSGGTVDCRQYGFTPVAEASAALHLHPGSLLAGWRAYLACFNHFHLPTVQRRTFI